MPKYPFSCGVRERIGMRWMARPGWSCPALPGIALVLGALAPGCGTGADERTSTARIDTLPNGVVHVRNADPGTWSDEERWEIVEDLRIGVDDPADPATFSQVVALGARPTGDIVVADGAAQELRVFDAAGRYLRSLGRKGSGPGEFVRISGITWDAGGTMWVADAGNARYTRYDADGRYLDVVPMRAPGAVLPWLGTLGADGYLYDAAMRVAGNRLEVRYYRLDRTSGDVLDTLPPLQYTPDNGPDVSAALFRLLPRLSFRLAADGEMWFGVTGQYRLMARTLGGDTVRVVELDRANVRLSGAERDSVVRTLREQGALGVEVDVRDIPREKPAFDRIHFDDAGHVIVEPQVRPGDVGRVFDVFERDGRFLGQARSAVAFVTFPALPVFSGGFIYGVTIDGGTGMDAVVRARIVDRKRGS